MDDTKTLPPCPSSSASSAVRSSLDDSPECRPVRWPCWDMLRLDGERTKGWPIACHTEEGACQASGRGRKEGEVKHDKGHSRVK